MDEIARGLKRLRAYVEREGFRGYDPYDALEARMNFARLGKWGPILAIQLQKRNPVNLRPLLGVEKNYNPKGMGLLLHAYATLYEAASDKGALATASFLFDWLCENYSRGYSGYCWGYNFDWASPAKYLRAYTPSVVVTGFVGKGLFKYYQVTGEQRALEVLRSACDFILRDLSQSETPDGLCFSYTPVARDCCYNASLLGAELLAKAYAVTGEEQLRELSRQAVHFVLARQHEDGRWNYSLDPSSGRERRQVDFHQGFVLDTLDAYLRYADAEDTRCRKAMERGAAFYRYVQFAEEGRSLWRLPRKWPVDIHHQAQGILTFSRLAHLDPAYRRFAKTIAHWTLNHMQDPDGFFYYRKGRLYTNKISYMRWGQAWMMLALACLLSRSPL